MWFEQRGWGRDGRVLYGCRVTMKDASAMFGFPLGSAGAGILEGLHQLSCLQA